MSDNETKVLDRMNPSKRAFVKGVVAVTAFAVPTMVSFDMKSMNVGIGTHAYASNCSVC